MVEAVDILLSVIGSAFVITIGYIINGQFQTGLEKRKTSYHSKLEAYRKVNEAVVGIFQGLQGLRYLTSIPSEELPSGEATFSLAWQTGLAREAERPLGTTVTQEMAEDFKETSLEGWKALEGRAAALSL